MYTRRSFLVSGGAFAATSGLDFWTLGASEDPPATGPANVQLKPFDDLFFNFLKDNSVAGAGVAITRQGKLVYARGFGYANREKKIAAEPTARFRLASISKPITAVAILQLVGSGKVKLDTPVIKYFPPKLFLSGTAKRDPRWEKITVRHCLHHTAGWDRDRKGGYDPIADPRRIMRALRLGLAPTPDEIVSFLLEQPLDFDPGEKMVYSNVGYLVLGRVIESVTKQKYEAWVKKNVLAPAGAIHMHLAKGLPEHREKGEVLYYDSKQRTGSCLCPPRVGEKVPLPDGAENVEHFEAHGGWVASAIDLIRFASAFDYDKKSPLLSAALVEEMWARPKGAAGFDEKNKPLAAYYGCGWSVRPTGDSNRANTWHNGSIAGTSTLLVRRHDGLNWAVLFNTDANPDGKELSTLIDGPMHKAAAAVKEWPKGDLFEKFPVPK